jgi:Tol biopolymer transport system component
MRYSLLTAVLLGSSLFGQNARFGAQIPVQTEFLAKVTQLTTDGKSGKPHWSHDGRNLLIVSAAEGKCPQAYWMDLGTRTRRLATSGKGSVRSIAPLVKSKSWVFDSTQDSGDACAPSMLGSVPAEFNIFVNNEKGKMERLAGANGYDAEVDVSTSEKLIVYTSQASGDIEIWTMEFDGMNKRQLTRSPGFDGDPNVSSDGRRIVFRSTRARSAEQQKQVKEELAFGRAQMVPSEIYVMSLKGTDEKQITSFGCSVLHPAWTPDNRRIVFSANLPSCQGDQYEMFMVNLDGTGLVQLTKGSKYAGEAAFSADGRYIAFTRDGNVFMAEWLAPAPPPETLTPLSKP